MTKTGTGWLFNPRQSLRRQILILAALPLALSVAGAWAVYRAMDAVSAVEDRAARTSISLGVNQGLLTSVLDAQTGIRGFVISGEEGFLQPYEDALKDFATMAAQGRTLWQDDTDRIDMLASLEQTFSRYRRDVAEPLIELRRRIVDPRNADDAPVTGILEIIQVGEDKALVDELKRSIRVAIDEDRRILEQQISVGHRQRNIALAAGVAGPVVAVLLVLVFLGRLFSRLARGLGMLADAAARVQENDFEFRLDLRENRELHRAAWGFNSMADNLSRRQREARTLDRMGRLLQNSRSTAEAHATARRYLPRIFQGVSGAVCVHRPSRDLVEPEVTWGEARFLDTLSIAFEPGQCWALRSGYAHHRTLRDDDPPCEHLAPGPEADESPGSGQGETLCVPMHSGDDVLGVLVIESPPETVLEPSLRAQAGLVAETIALTISNLQLREALRNQSIRDPLTGLYNRRFLEESIERELARSRRTGHDLSLIVLDADHFKRFNDSWGHDAGDAVLVALAGLFTEQARDMDTVCRLGGEEFLIMLPRTDIEAALEVAERIRASAEDLQIRNQGRTLDHISLSLGVAASSSHGMDGTSLIKAADDALYRAKSSGRNRVERA